MSIREKSQTVVKLTRELAAEFAAMEAIRDRPIGERRIQHYIAEVAEGRFRSPEWARAKSLESGKTYRVNGQHTSTMFSRMDFLPDLSVIVSDYECDTDIDVCTLWSTFDSKDCTRRMSDINHVFSATVPELAKIPATVVNACVSGINFYKSGGAYSVIGSVSYAVRSRVIVDHSDFILFADGLGLSSNENTHLRKVGVVAAMFATWLIARNHAEMFWSAVREETGERPNLPDRVLAKWLRSIPAYGKGSKRTAVAKEVYAKSIVAWNAWVDGTTVSILKYGPKQNRAPAVKRPKPESAETPCVVQD